MRKYYAWYNVYGHISFDSFGGNNGYIFLAFASAADRNEWVDDHCYDASGNIIAGRASRSEVEDSRNCGSGFTVIDGICCRINGWTGSPTDDDLYYIHDFSGVRDFGTYSCDGKM